MEYKIAAHPTKYAGVQFRSRLEARWAAFFDLLDWKWEYEPIDLDGWVPDFRVTVPDMDFTSMTDYSEFLAEVKPYREREEWRGHPVTLFHPIHERSDWDGNPLDPSIEPSWGCMALGENPDVSRASVHYHKWAYFIGDFKNLYATCFDNWNNEAACPACINWDKLWKEAGNRTQWRPR